MTFLRTDSAEIITSISRTLPASVAELGILIPTPKLVLLPGSQRIAAKWNSENKEFLKYDPKYYLFRYRGKGKHANSVVNHTPNRKGFTHPLHQSGANKSNSAWWSGQEYDNSGMPLGPRNTEWDVQTKEGVETILDMEFSDWMYIVGGGSMPAARSDLRVRGGRNNKAFAAYFQLCIGIQVDLPLLGGCPITFGPRTETFSLRPVNNNNGGFGMFTGYGWFI